MIEHAEGCLLLAELMMRSENPLQAIRYAELGYQLEPWNNQFTLFLIKYNPESSTLYARVEKEFKVHSESPTPLLNYAYLLIKKYLISQAPIGVKIETAKQMLDGLIRQNQSIPFAYALLGAANLGRTS